MITAAGLSALLWLLLAYLGALGLVAGFALLGAFLDERRQQRADDNPRAVR